MQFQNRKGLYFLPHLSGLAVRDFHFDFNFNESMEKVAINVPEEFLLYVLISITISNA